MKKKKNEILPVPTPSEKKKKKLPQSCRTPQGINL